MSDPSFGPLVVGDVADDDATVIDSQVQTVSAPPDLPVTPIDATPLMVPVAPTRLVSVRQLLDPAWGSATPIMPADTTRKVLHARVTSTAADTTDAVVITSEGGPVLGAARIAHGQTLDITGHTGGILALAVGTNTCYLDVWSVTE